MTDAAVSALVTPTRIKPKKVEVIRAYKAFRRLVANKEDTRQVFEIMQALNGDSTGRGYRRLISTVQGGRLAYQRTELALLFDDRGFTGKFPIGTIGHAYRAFMDSENLSADGLAQVSREAGNANLIEIQHPLAWFGRRIRDNPRHLAHPHRLPPRRPWRALPGGVFLRADEVAGLGFHRRGRSAPRAARAGRQARRKGDLAGLSGGQTGSLVAWRRFRGLAGRASRICPGAVEYRDANLLQCNSRVLPRGRDGVRRRLDFRRRLQVILR